MGLNTLPECEYEMYAKGYDDGGRVVYSQTLYPLDKTFLINTNVLDFVWLTSPDVVLLDMQFRKHTA
jgi:hypothetical protein